MTRQKGKFLTILFSLIPGCGQLYLGFMKRGLTLMLLFGGGIVLTSLTGIGELALLCIVVWFYAFFDALNLNSTPPEVFATVEDQYLTASSGLFAGLQGNVRRYAGIGLIAVGIIVLWRNVFWQIINEIGWLGMEETYHTLYRAYSIISAVAIGLLIVIIGIRLVVGKKKEVEKLDE